jgi:hypothetical protein
MDNGVPVNLFQNGIEIVIQPQEINDECFLHPLVKEDVAFLAERKNPAGGLDKIGIDHLGKTENLPAFQGILKGE